MVFFITFLRVLATCFITNAHYTGVYPSDMIANGGLIGDVLFFAVSGYCLYPVKLSFPKWYAKRMYRVYTPVVIMTGFYLLIGAYHLSESSLFWWFVYPTKYHFVASIMVLYLPYYICMRIEAFKNHLVYLTIGIAVCWVAVYFSVFDRSYYHIDAVKEPMIRFLFMECMIIGAWFRQNDAAIRNNFKKWHLFATVGMLFLYFASKLVFSRIVPFAPFQIVNQFCILALLVCLMRLFAGLDAKLESLPPAIRRVIYYLSSITLELYVVQKVLIAALSPIKHFPINWLVITTSILLAAGALHIVCDGFYRMIGFLYQRGITE